eukprot:gnl/TRDRNA2_/TRDRNA2_167494_c7_seq5.p1 gnl/TRDRNA2_/TRDRNA2_167494_c7~~gnl/TRDRNA2_/TRDRNA2_167494_c7_seq5.p1  ORF type:complete len:202 (+),score=24.68 gnl/TRDRNA2_/TRDRNA2_167494_c7_seq5:2-607(+)
MLNFLLAIIVEAYDKVKEINESIIAEQAFFTDVYWTVKGELKTILHKWPKKQELIAGIQSMRVKKTVSIVELRSLFPTWRVKSVKAFIEHYGSLGEVMRPPDSRESDQMLMIDEIEARVACLLERPKLSRVQRLTHAFKSEHMEIKKLRADLAAVKKFCEDAEEERTVVRGLLQHIVDLQRRETTQTPRYDEVTGFRVSKV